MKSIINDEIIVSAKRFLSYQGVNIDDLSLVNVIPIVDFKVYVVNLISTKNEPAFLFLNVERNEHVAIAFSLSNKFELNKENYALMMELALASIDKPIAMSRSTRRGEVPPLLKSHWHQESPYSDLAPGLAGCVAIGMGQIMKFHNYPKHGIKAIPQYEDLPEIPVKEMHYNWDLIKESYDNESSKEARLEAARLVFHVGCSVKMYYGISGSTANPQSIKPALVNYFNYDKTCKFIDRFDDETGEYHISKEEIISVLDDELVNGRPVNIGIPGHDIVCDGKLDDYYHMNYGWGGYSDGFYHIDVLMKKIANLTTRIKPKEKDTLTLIESLPEKLLISDTVTPDVFVKLTTSDLTGFSGRVGIFLESELGALKYKIELDDHIELNQGDSKDVSLQLLPDNIKNGDYQLSFVCQDSRYNTDWRMPVWADGISGTSQLSVNRRLSVSTLKLMSPLAELIETEISSSVELRVDILSSVQKECRVAVTCWDNNFNFVGYLSEVFELKLESDISMPVIFNLSGENVITIGDYILLISELVGEDKLTLTNDTSEYTSLFRLKNDMPRVLDDVFLMKDIPIHSVVTSLMDDEFNVVVNNDSGRVFGAQGINIGVFDQYNNLATLAPKKELGPPLIFPGEREYGFHYSAGKLKYGDYIATLIVNDEGVYSIIPGRDSSVKTYYPVKYIESQVGYCKVIGGLEAPNAVKLNETFTINTRLKNTGDSTINMFVEPRDYVVSNLKYDPVEVFLLPGEEKDFSISLSVFDEKESVDYVLAIYLYSVLKGDEREQGALTNIEDNRIAFTYAIKVE